jgi:hypothetical protein
VRGARLIWYTEGQVRKDVSGECKNARLEAGHFFFGLTFDRETVVMDG